MKRVFYKEMLGKKIENKKRKTKLEDNEKNFIKDIENIALLLKEAGNFKKEISQFKKNDAQIGILKKLYTISEENRKLKMENLRLKAEIVTPYPVGTTTGKINIIKNRNNNKKSRKYNNGT